MFTVTLAAVGRLKAGSERDLVLRYLQRATAAGRALGIGIGSCEIDEGRSRRPDDRRHDEAQALRAAIAPGAIVIALDETGRNLTSSAFAALIAATRDEGRNALALVIGGADGLAPDYRESANHLVAFGAMTWPHQLVRAMAAEQIYRAVTILAGHPYHRA